MTVIDYSAARAADAHASALPDLVAAASIEVMPRTAAKIEDFNAILPQGTRVYIAHLDGTAIDDMIATARRLTDAGHAVMPHVPARLIANKAELERWIRRYRDEAGVDQALVLAGGIATPKGDFRDAMQLLDTGLFDKHGFTRLHGAGHPEGNRDIDPDGGTRVVDAALAWKTEFSKRTDAEMAIVTQFVFDAEPVIKWTARIKAAGVDLPVHVGLAGPAKLQTLIKFAVACGVGPSIAVLKKRAKDLSKLVMPYTPDEVVTDIAAHVASVPDSPMAGLHIFPLGGIKRSADWMAENAAPASRYRSRA